MEILLGIGTGLAATAIVGVLTLLWRRWRHPSLPATKADTHAIAEALARQSEQIKELERKSVRGPEYLDGLPEAVNQTLRAAYQEARLLQLEGDAAQNAEKHQDAIDRFTRALALAENHSQRAALHLLRGQSYHHLDQYDRAHSDYQEALQLSQSIPVRDDAARACAASLGSLGNLYQDRGEPEKAEAHYKKALGIHSKIRDRAGEALDLGNLGGVYLDRRELHKAKEHHDHALKIHRRTRNRRGQAINLCNLGNVYLHSHDLDKAAKYYDMALEIYKHLGDRRGQAD